MKSESEYRSQELEWMRTQTKLSSEHWQRIVKDSMGIVTMGEFKKWITGIPNEQIFLFCIDYPKGRMGEVGEEYGLFDWSKGIEKLGISRKTSFSELFMNYMQGVINSGNRIVFFIPPNIISHQRANVTRYEFLILLSPENQHALARTLFVYDESLKA